MNKGFAAILGAVALAGCNAVTDMKSAEQGVAAFHQAMDAGQFAGIYDGSASDMKSSLTRDEFINFASALHQKLGAYKSGKTVSWKDNAGTGGHYVTLERQAQFERGPGTEQFVFHVESKRAVLAGYHVNSKALITS